MNTETTETTETVSASVLAKLATLSLRDNLMLALGGEARYFSFEEISAAATSLKLNKGVAPSQRGLKIALSRLSGENGVFVCDESKYWFGIRTNMMGVPFPEVPAGFVYKSGPTPSAKKTSNGLKGRPSNDPTVNYTRIVNALLAGKDVAQGKLSKARKEYAVKLAYQLANTVEVDVLVDGLILAEYKAQKLQDETVADNDETVADNEDTGDDSDNDELEDEEGDEEVAA